MTEAIQKIIKDNITKYYPELNPAKVCIKASRNIKSGHKSDIYKFAVYEGKEHRRTICVKKRKINTNYSDDIRVATQNEYENLKFFNGKVRVPRPLDIIQDQNVLIYEKVNGKSLNHYINPYGIFLSAYYRGHVRKLFKGVGCWLKQYHEAGQTGELVSIDAEAKVAKAVKIVKEYETTGQLGQELMKLVQAMKNYTVHLKDYRVPVVRKHGDFQPMNIICHKGEVAVIDMDILQKDINIVDICNFISGVEIVSIKNLIYQNRNGLEALLQDYIRAYFQDEDIPYQAIHFVRALGAIQFLNACYNRNSSFLRRKRVISFYTNIIKQNTERLSKL